jgi:hypothetical protein
LRETGDALHPRPGAAPLAPSALAAPVYLGFVVFTVAECARLPSPAAVSRAGTHAADHRVSGDDRACIENVRGSP